MSGHLTQKVIKTESSIAGGATASAVSIPSMLGECRKSSSTPVDVFDAKFGDEDISSDHESGSECAVKEQIGHESCNSAGTSTPKYLIDVSGESSLDTERQDITNSPIGNMAVISPAMYGSPNSSPRQYHHQSHHSPFSAVSSFSEKPCRSVVKQENSFLQTSSTVHGERYVSPIMYSSDTLLGMEVKSEHEMPVLPLKRALTRDVGYLNNMYRSLSCDFAQTLHVQPYLIRPNMPRSVSPKIDFQQEPEDLSTRKRTRSDATPSSETRIYNGPHVTEDGAKPYKE